MAGLVFAVSQTAAAVPITDTVIVGGKEWAQVSLFTFNSWDTMNTQCPDGMCTSASTINGYDLAGWTWASGNTVQALFDSFTGQTGNSNYFEGDSSWAPAFLELFNSTASVGGGRWIEVSGWIADPHSNPRLGETATIADKTLPQLDRALLSGAFRTDSNEFIGAWIVRDSNQVPVPSTLVLLFLGLAGFWKSRRRDQGVRVLDMHDLPVKAPP